MTRYQCSVCRHVQNHYGTCASCSQREWVNSQMEIAHGFARMAVSINTSLYGPICNEDQFSRVCCYIFPSIYYFWALGICAVVFLGALKGGLPGFLWKVLAVLLVFIPPIVLVVRRKFILKESILLGDVLPCFSPCNKSNQNIPETSNVSNPIQAEQSRLPV